MEASTHIDRFEQWLNLHQRSVYLICLVLTVFGLGWIIGPFLWAPNSHLYTFGGDGLVLYYDAAYHIFHGKQGVMLDAMLHPKEELIFLTDAQGALVVAWQWFSRNIADLSTYIAGLIHTTNNIGILLASPFIYSILVRLGTLRIVALLFTPLIVLLSPQMLRLAGHFGLAYPFLIPMTIWWLLRKNRKFDLQDALIVLTLMFFTFNNPYVGFSAGLTMLLFGGLFTFFNFPKIRNSSQIFIPVIGTITALLIPYFTFKMLDPFADRMELQWGVFNFRTTFAGSIFPDGSLASNWLGKSPGVEFEAIQYLGIVSIVVVLSGLLLGVARLIFLRKQILNTLSNAQRTWALYALSSFIAYLICFDWNLSTETEFFLEKKAGFLLMFKAVPRLAWPFYFGVAITGALFISSSFEWLKRRKSIVAYLLLIGLFIFNCIDVAVFHKTRYAIAHTNMYELSSFQSLKEKMNVAGVVEDDYQAILSIPRQLSWNGNVLMDWKWATHFGSTNTSLALGLPMINANLGRAPLRPLMDVTQLMSQPEINRSDFLNNLPSQKPILLIHGKADTILSEGETFLLDLAEPVYSDDLVVASRLNLQLLQQRTGSLSHTRELTECGAVSQKESTLASHRLEAKDAGYDDFHYLTEFNASRVDRDSVNAHLTGWLKATSGRYDQGNFSVRLFDKEHNLSQSDWIEVRRITDASNGWFYISRVYKVQKGDSLVLSHSAPQKTEMKNFKVAYSR